MNNRENDSAHIEKANTESLIDREARLVAVEYMTCHLYNIVMRAMKADEQAIRQSEDTGLLAIALQPLLKSDRELSDRISGEASNAIARLAAAAREMRGSTKS